MNTITPNLFVKDLSKSLIFYQNLGFSVVNRVPEEGDPVWAMLKCGEVVIMLQSLDSLGEELPEIKRSRGGALLLYIQIKGIRTFFDKLQAQPIPILKGLEKTFYGATEFSIADPDDFVLTFAEDEE
ncbi:MAG: VOC family protein [Bacteroidia bacterium]|nr:VOC family protein [Bacteroidia bacterium]